MRNSFRNALSNTIGFIFPAFIGLITTPYIVHKLGLEIYGIYILAISLMGLLSFLDLGFGQGIIKFVSHYEAKGDFNRINDIINTSFVINILMGLLGFILIFSLSGFLSEKVFKVNKDYLSMSVKAFKIVAFGFLLNILLSTFSNIPRALQRYDIAVIMQNIVWFSSIISGVILLYLGYGLTEMLVAYIVFQIFGLTLYFYISKKLLPFMKISLKFKKDVFNEIFRFSIFTAINSITGNMVFRVDKMIISYFLGTSAVTYYQIPFMIVQVANNFISSIIQFLFPAVSFLASIGNQERLKEIYKKSTRGVIALSLIIMSGLILLGKPFLSFWIGHQIAEISYPLMVIISIVFFFVSISNVGYYFYNGLGMAKINMISSFIGTACYLISAFLLIPIFGLKGAAFSFSFILVPYPIYIYILNKIIDSTLLQWYLKLLLKTTTLIILCLALINFKFYDDLYVTFFVSFLFLIFELLIFFLIGILKYDDFNKIKEVLRI